MERVSFKIAQALEEVGYPQFDTESADDSLQAYDCEGELWPIRFFDQHPQDYYSAPYATEILFWLWREKRIFIEVLPNIHGVEMSIWKGCYDNIYKEDYKDPEEAIIAAIEYLVDNNLIK